MSHKHRLKKHKYPNGTAIYFCTLDCNFKVEAALALGKEVLCNICNEPFIMNEASLKLAKPHCINCGKIGVKDADGKTRYVNKRKADTKILQTVAADTTNELKERLQGTIRNLNEDDI